MRSRAGWISVVLAAALASAPGCGPGESPLALDARSTDVLLVTLCTVRADHLGAYGYERPTSPTIDALADQGVVFERALTNAPWTRPSLASTITGLYPRALEIDDLLSWNNDRMLHGSFETLAERFSAAGFFTVGVTANPNVNELFGFGQGYDVYRDTGRLWREGYSREKLTGHRVADLLFEALADVEPERRIFAHVVLVDAHTPFRTDVADAAGVPSFGPDVMARYDQQILYADGVVERVHRGLLGLGRRNLLVVVHSDHGEAFGQIQPEDLGHGRWLFDSTLWVPLVIQHPALEPRRIAGIAESVDLAPTLLELLGIAAPEGAFHGRSFAAALRGGGPEPAPRAAYVTESGFENVNMSALLVDDWKLVVNRREPVKSRLELYPRPGDERENVVAREKATARRLLHDLREWRKAHPGLLAGAVERAVVKPEEVEELRALGYVEEGARDAPSAPASR